MTFDLNVLPWHQSAEAVLGATMDGMYVLLVACI